MAGDVFLVAEGEVLEVLETGDGVDAVGAELLAAFELEAFDVGAEGCEGFDGLVVEGGIEPFELE